jgi:polyhydroxyalkanoate synthase subunit PhaC
MTAIQNPLPRPDQRWGPRPLALHMAVEGWILQMSFAGLMSSKSAWPLSSPLGMPESLLRPLRAVVAQVLGQSPESPDALPPAWNDVLEPASFINAITQQAGARMEDFVRGVRAYQAHPYRRSLKAPASTWRRGAAHLLDYGGPVDGSPVLFVPSLVNRAYILDLAEDRSLLRSSAAWGLRTYLLDWGEPGAAERQFTIEDYIDGVLIPALEEIKARTGEAPRLVGYCLGGTLAVAPAVLRPDLISALALLAAPWDFHKGTEASRVLLEMSRPMLDVMLGAEGVASVDMLQALFASLDPTLVGRKFRGFTNVDPSSEHARRFVELEDWLNDGVSLAGPVAKEVLFDWYVLNAPAKAAWKVGDVTIDPHRIACPTLAYIPTHDRIVPPDSASALTEAIPGAKAISVDLGHIGMVVGAGAPARVYAPLLAWLKDPSTP